MKSLLFVLIFVALLLGQTKVINKGDTFKADQNYNLFTDSAMIVLIKDKMELRTLQQKELEYKFQVSSKDERIKILNENMAFHKEISDKYHSLWVGAEEMLMKKAPRKWYESKSLWYGVGICSGVGVAYISSEIINNINTGAK